MNKKDIKALRKFLGISQEDLAGKLGVNRRTIGTWESGQSEPQKRYAGKLQEIFDDCPQLPEAPSEGCTSNAKRCNEEDKTAERIALNARAIQRKFTVGKCYRILDTPEPSEHTTLQQSILRYEQQEGIHHVFREVRGKWIVTYTDAQLVGKHVKEVEG